MSAFRIIDSLREVEASLLRDKITGARYKMLSRLSEDGEIIYDVMQVERGLSVVQLA